MCALSSATPVVPPGKFTFAALALLLSGCAAPFYIMRTVEKFADKTPSRIRAEIKTEDPIEEKKRIELANQAWAEMWEK